MNRGIWFPVSALLGAVLGGCVTHPFDRALVQPATELKVYTDGELVKRKYTILKRIWVGTEHAAFFVHGQPSREAAELSLKMEAVKLGADGVLNMFCGDQGSYLSNNASYFCHANAIKFN